MSLESPYDDSLLTSPLPAFSSKEVADFARRHFGLAGTLRPLTGERDLIFLLEDAREGQFTIKVANPAEDPLVLDFQLSALDHAAHRAPRIPLPRVRHTLAGPSAAIVEDASGTRHLFYALSFLPGTPLARVAMTAGLAAAAGGVLADLDRALDGFTHAGQGRRLLWDHSRLAELAGHINDIPDTDQRRLAAIAFERFESLALPRLAALPRQVIHNDLNPHNVIIGDDGAPSGIIDFGDMLEAPRVNDLAVAVSYVVAHGRAPLGFAPAMVSSYLQRLPLGEEEVALLPVLVAARCALSLAIIAWRSRLYPENAAYIMRNAAASADALERLNALSPEEAARLLACGSELS